MRWWGPPDSPEAPLKWVSYCRVHCKMARRGSHAASGGSLVTEAGEAFLAAQYRQHVKDAGGGGASGQRDPERLGNGAQFEMIGLGKGPHRGFRGLRGPWRHRLERKAKFANQFPRFRRQQRRRLWIHL